MKGKDAISAVVGGAFFAVPYLALSFTLAPALAIGCAAFGASELVLSGMVKNNNLKDTDLPLYIKITNAKKQNKELLDMIPKIELEETRKSLNDIHGTVDRIIKTIEDNPKKGDKVKNFFEYYLPVLLKIVKRYDEVENQKLSSKEGKAFMDKADKMIMDTSKAFDSILASLYSRDILDADADMKVYDMMLKADGITPDNLLMKGSESDEK